MCSYNVEFDSTSCRKAILPFTPTNICMLSVFDSQFLTTMSESVHRLVNLFG